MYHPVPCAVVLLLCHANANAAANRRGVHDGQQLEVRSKRKPERREFGKACLLWLRLRLRLIVVVVVVVVHDELGFAALLRLNVQYSRHRPPGVKLGSLSPQSGTSSPALRNLRRKRPLKTLGRSVRRGKRLKYTYR